MWLQRLGQSLGAPFTRLRGSVRLRLLVAVLAFSSAVTLVLTAVQLYFEYQRGLDVIENRLTDISNSYLGSLGEGLWRLDPEQLQLQLEGILRLPDIRAVEVRETTASGTPLVIALGQRAEHAVVSRELPIVYSVAGATRQIGTLRVEATLDGLYRELVNSALVILVTQGLKTFLVSLFIIYIIHRLVTRHLAALAEFVHDYDLHAPPPPLRLPRRPPKTEDELEQVVAAFNAMCANLQQAYCDLRDREARIHRLIESNIIGILLADFSGNVKDANDAFLNMVGYTREELLTGAISWKELTPPEHLAASKRAIDEMRRCGSCAPFEKEYLRKDGTRIPVLIGGVTLDGSSEENVAFVLDMTEHERAETERRARQAAELASQAKSAFLANMSHELRTPLNAILGYAQLLKSRNGLPQPVEAGLDTIQQSGEHLLGLVGDILDLSKIEAGRLDLRPEAVDLPALLKVVADIIRVKTEEQGLVFVCETAPNLPRAVRADARRLRQILLNLLGNAVKFTEQGEVGLRVTRLAADGPEARLRFEVRDTGPGIRPDQLELIFKPFEQVSDEPHRASGAGLGLAISRQLAHLMNSEIHVESKLGKGSLFRFDLSLEVVEPEVAAPPATDAVVGYRGPRKKILVVDDVEINRAILADMLTYRGFEVAEAATGLQALTRIESWSPDLVLLDMVMPEMDGLETIRRIRQMPGRQKLPIVMVSASTSPGDEAKSLAAGADAFLTKPIDQDALYEQVGIRLSLSWSSEHPAGPAEPHARRAAEVLVPPPKEMQVLYRLARAGNMRDIRERADYLVSLDDRYRPFADRLRTLAQAYQSKSIVNMIEEHLASTGCDSVS